jgi:multiple sugar transport system substrate-binding protein
METEEAAPIRDRSPEGWLDRYPSWFVLLAGLCAGLLVAALAAQAGRLGDDEHLEPGTLRLVADRDQSLGAQRHALVAEWNAIHDSDLQVEIVEVPASATAARSEIVASAQSRTIEADVYSLDITWIPEFAEAGLIRPLDEDDLETGGFLTQPLEACRYAGALWALPFNTDAGLLYYRKDVWGEEPALGTWEEVFARIREVFDRSEAERPAGLEAGFAGQFADYEGLTVNALEAIWADDRDVVVDGEVQDGWEEGLAVLRQGLESTDPPLVLRESLGFDELQTTQAFLQGRVLFMRNWPVAYRQLTEAGEGEAPPMDPQKIGVASLPGPSVLGGQNLAVAASTDQPRAAQALIEFLTGARSQQKLFERGGFAPTQEVVYHDPGLGGGPEGTHPYLWTLHEVVEGGSTGPPARPRPSSRHYELFSAEFRAAALVALTAAAPPGDPEVLTEALEGRRRAPDDAD